MRRFGHLLLIGLCLLMTACQNDDWPSSPETNLDHFAFKLVYDDHFDTEKSQSSKASDNNYVTADYDHVEMAVANPAGEIVQGLKGLYDPTTSEVRISGLQQGEYQLLVFGIRGDFTQDGAQFHTIKTLSDPWLTFPASLNKPLTAEYYYSITPFSVVATPSDKGNVLSVVLDDAVVQRRIIGRTDFSFAYNSLSVETAVTTKQVTLESPYFYTDFSAGGQFGGRSDGNACTMDLNADTTYLFPPTVSGEPLHGEVEITTRNYRGNNIRRAYAFTLEEVAPNAIGQINTPVVHPDDDAATLFVTDQTYEKIGLEYILQDNEPKAVYTNSAQRSFNTAKPLQIAIMDDGRLHVRFYSPRPLTNVLLQARIPSVSSEFFDLAFFDRIPGFADYYGELPMTQRKTFTRTASGRILEMEPISIADLKTAELQIVCSDPFWEKLQAIKHGWTISFHLYDTNPDLPNGGPVGNWMGIRPVHCREAVAIFLNITYLSDMPEYQAHLEANAGQLYNNAGPGNLVAPSTVLQQMRQARSLRVGLVYTGYGVVGLGGGTTFGVYQGSFLQHYTGTYACEIILHELGHVMGYNHSSSFTYGPWAQSITNKFYVQNISKLPIDSPSYLNSSQNPNIYK